MTEVFTQIPNDGHIITYKFYYLQTAADYIAGIPPTFLAELPLEQVGYSYVVDGPGSWQATLNVEDPNVQSAGWLTATQVNQTALFIDIDGTLVYGGIVQSRKYKMSTQQVTLSGTDFYGYLSQLIQAYDYTNTWATAPGAAAVTIGQQVLLDSIVALEAPFSPIAITQIGPVPPGDESTWITATFPQSQEQTVDAILSQLSQLGFMVGIDYACDVAYLANDFFPDVIQPTPVINLSYPRRGLSAALDEATMVIDLSEAIDLEYDEDGTTQSNDITEQTGSSGGISSPYSYDNGYILLQQVISHASMSPAAAPTALLDAFGAGDLATFAYPQTAPVLTVPLFASFGTPGPLGASISGTNIYNVGDDFLFIVGQTAGDQPPTCPRFPDGLSYWFRITRADVTIADEDLSTVALTMNIPPATTPVAPPT